MRSAGDNLISIDAQNPQAAQRLAKRLRESGFFQEVVAGIDSVVVQFDLVNTDRRNAEVQIQELVTGDIDESDIAQEVTEIPIVYGGEFGPDFASVCEQLELTRERFIEAHCGEYIVDMLGFTPGFAYVGGLSECLNVPRLTQPRTRVAAGSVGIADRRTGLYSLPGPGGWPIVGHTVFQLFDASAEIPFALMPGARVRFVAVERQ